MHKVVEGCGGGELSLILSSDDYVLCNLQQVAWFFFHFSLQPPPVWNEAWSTSFFCKALWEIWLKKTQNIIEGPPSTLINSVRQTAVSPLCRDTLNSGQRGSAAPLSVRCSEVVAGGLSRSLGESVAAQPYTSTTLEARLFYKREVNMGLVYLWVLNIW